MMADHLALVAHPTLRPSSILRPAAISPLGVSYLFLSSILHLNQLKTGPFHEHSPLLHNIATTVPNWAKVESGLCKMYKVEVLQKVPVVQHFWFGGVLGWRRAGTGAGPGTGEELPSSGGGEEAEGGEGVQDEPLGRCGAEEVVAPWKLPSLSGTTPPLPTPRTASSGGCVASASAPPSRTPSSSSSSTRQRVSPESTIASSIPTAVPRPFVPPALFPDRRRRSSLNQELLPASDVSTAGGAARRGVESEGGRTVAEEGGAAAVGSPFGVLPSVTGRGAGLGGSGGQEATKAPWAR